MTASGVPKRESEASHPAAEARIQSVARAKALLDAMSSGEWVSLRDLATRTGLAKTTAFNLVTALVDIGLAERDAKAGAYRLSLQHLVYGKAVERRLDIAAIARPHLIRLCAATRETVNLALPGPTDAVIVESLEGSQSLRVSSYSGTRAAYHSTACGRALLAYQPPSFRRIIYNLGSLPAATDRTLTDPEALETVLEQCRSRGWTTEFEENEIGGACVAAPIFAPGGEAIAAVSIAGPSARFEPEAIEKLGRLLVASLAEITDELAASASGQADHTAGNRR
ncbi:IclR family transcriptional regulator [Kaistia dalseonensis]|uniref:IclR family acetate operon transcriptional repressor n=1 Tax=Kaistia dalseonensis TaxID=410840 RepID=A0ABU0H4T6_9HYPH|nr:IclR family transcriptional regulator [Kaistia dalseonensis]MCX5494735.1 IclR family transcriptional regulator [Kaistia dalseonensis]MDQ0437316.1 IclR family acetate operon transcriptional repressor [Kaistia dalseonensis]